ncbi:MAG: TlpA family protein disulfide reductase [Pseudoflavonifractor sp.]|nr:TlpA family protein disulfide reductase [Alloprevotella sp.]MCM1115969.1 TlpA family protein disulfide reductase [Pseudoflavonifractor sp.]
MKHIAILAAALFAASSAMALPEGSVKVIVPQGTAEIAVIESTIADAYSGTRAPADTIPLQGQTIYSIPTDPEDAMSISVMIVNRPGPDGSMPAARVRPMTVYAAPGEEITLDMTKPLFPASGSELMDKISAWDIVSDSVFSSFRSLKDATDEERKAALDGFNELVTAQIKANADNPFGVYMITRVPGAGYMPAAYDLVNAEAAMAGILAPLYTEIGSMVEQTRARERAAEKIKAGLPAPAFSLPAPDGSMVSLADYKGKWVMLDFWGSWCGWCIKGIPQMKEQWGELKDRNVVFISVACGDSKDTWLEALKKYELPWVNCWQDPEAPRESQLSTLYAVAGYPTKLVIDPQGNIALIVVGEDPSFYDQLRALL